MISTLFRGLSTLKKRQLSSGGEYSVCPRSHLTAKRKTAEKALHKNDGPKFLNPKSFPRLVRVLFFVAGPDVNNVIWKYQLVLQTLVQRR